MNSENIHLTYSLFTAEMGHHINKSPFEVIKELGISFEAATPQSMADEVWFWNCRNVPDNLPEYITRLKICPLDAIGHGLSKDEAYHLMKKGD